MSISRSTYAPQGDLQQIIAELPKNSDLADGDLLCLQSVCLILCYSCCSSMGKLFFSDYVIFYSIVTAGTATLFMQTDGEIYFLIWRHWCTRLSRVVTMSGKIFNLVSNSAVLRNKNAYPEHGLKRATVFSVKTFFSILSPSECENIQLYSWLKRRWHAFALTWHVFFLNFVKGSHRFIQYVIAN